MADTSCWERACHAIVRARLNRREVVVPVPTTLPFPLALADDDGLAAAVGRACDGLEDFDGEAGDQGRGGGAAGGERAGGEAGDLGLRAPVLSAAAVKLATLALAGVADRAPAARLATTYSSAIRP
jgi:hypothetical protein